LACSQERETTNRCLSNDIKGTNINHAGNFGLVRDGIIVNIIHDLGKISIPAEILSTPRKLTDIEFNIIKTHPSTRYDISKDIEFPWQIAQMVLQHHERLGGSSVPYGKAVN
jgi:HD-GYP domain-containing protein (c-di-GMP phosphodiesterase class II)